MNRYEIFKEKGYTYNPETGEIFNGKGKLCECLNGYGYTRLGTSDNKKHIFSFAHKFAWYCIYGNIDEGTYIDHIDRNRANNKINNLRLVTKQENGFNRGAKGYHWHKRDKKWQSAIKKDGKTIFLGLFDTEEEARQAYLEGKKIYHKI